MKPKSPLITEQMFQTLRFLNAWDKKNEDRWCVFWIPGSNGHAARVRCNVDKINYN